MHASSCRGRSSARRSKALIRNSFMHSLLAKGRLLYTHDHDDRRPLFAAARRSASATRRCSSWLRRPAQLPAIDKAHKWFITRGDLDYTALWILYAATPLAKIEVIGARLLADREVIPQALKLNPAFFKTVYTDLLNDEEDHEECASCAGRDRRLPAQRAPTSVRAGDRSPARGRRSAVVHRDRRPLQAELRRGRRDHGLRISGRPGDSSAKRRLPVQLTKKSNVEVQELAFFYATRSPTDVC